MTILDRYLFKELFFPFIIGILAFTTILSGSTILFQLVGDAVKYSIPYTDLILLILLKLPTVIALSIPMATLFATITAFGRLGNDLEILALRANGISISRLLVPVIVIGLAISFLNLWFSEAVVPRSATTAQNLFLTYRDNDSPKIQTNLNITEYKDRLPYRIINIAEKEGSQLRNITIAEYDQGALARLIRADKGHWQSAGSWQFLDGIMHYFQADDPRRITVIEFEKEFINIDLKPVDFDNRNKNVEEMTRRELKDKIAFQERTGKNPLKLIMDYHMKLSIAFSSLIYCILGASMGLRPHRSSSALGIGLSLLIIFVYIILMSVGMGLGLSGVFPPLIAAWFPNIVIGGFSLVLVSKLASQ